MACQRNRKSPVCRRLHIQAVVDTKEHNHVTGREKTMYYITIQLGGRGYTYTSKQPFSKGAAILVETPYGDTLAAVLDCSKQIPERVKNIPLKPLVLAPGKNKRRSRHQQRTEEPEKDTLNPSDGPDIDYEDCEDINRAEDRGYIVYNE